MYIAIFIILGLMLSQILLDGFLGEFMKFWFYSSSFCSNLFTTSHLTQVEAICLLHMKHNSGILWNRSPPYH